MKKSQLLSIVFALIMFTGITAGTAVAYAESDDDSMEHDRNDDMDYDSKYDKDDDVEALISKIDLLKKINNRLYDLGEGRVIL